MTDLKTAALCASDFEAVHGYDPDMGDDGSFFELGECAKCGTKGTVFTPSADLVAAEAADRRIVAADLVRSAFSLGHTAEEARALVARRLVVPSDDAALDATVLAVYADVSPVPALLVPSDVAEWLTDFADALAAYEAADDEEHGHSDSAQGDYDDAMEDLAERAELLLRTVQRWLDPHVCAECGTTEAQTYVVTVLDQDNPATRTEVCRSCDLAPWREVLAEFDANGEREAEAAGDEPADFDAVEADGARGAWEDAANALRNLLPADAARPESVGD